MNVLVTGGNGFLGSNISRKFLNQNHRVGILSNNTNNIKDILDKVEYMTWSSDLHTHILHFNPDVLIHCAWVGGNNYLDTNSLSQFNDNIPMGMKLIESIKHLNKKVSFVGLGSFAEYGNFTAPAKESDQEKPINLYGLSKYTFKTCSKTFCEKNSIEWSWIRPCYVFGKGDVETRLIPKLIKKFILDEKIELDSCKSIVDYIHVDDFSDMVYELVSKKFTGVFNVCSGQAYPVRHIVDTMKKVLNSKSIVIYNEKLDRNTPTYVCGDNSKIIDTLKNNYVPNMVRDILKTVN